MAKQKKKRNKVYTGKDASVTRPVVTRINAVNRNKVQQWWFEKKRFAKQKKKRNKVYTGQDASVTRPVVTRISAVNRNKVQQWWFEKKRFAKPVSIATAVVVGVVLLVLELIHLLGGGA